VRPLPADIDHYLGCGWAITGCSTSYSEAGIFYHTLLLRKDTSIVALTIGVNGSREVSRSSQLLTSQEPRSTNPLGDTA